MSPRRWCLYAVLGAAILLAGSCGQRKQEEVAREQSPGKTEEAPAAGGRLAFYRGDVTVFRGGAWGEARLGTDLAASDSVRTGEESEAELALPGGRTVRVGPGETMQVSALAIRKTEADQKPADGVARRARTLSRGTGAAGAAAPTATAGIRGAPPRPESADTTKKGSGP
jgi:hypothetical protein